MNRKGKDWSREELIIAFNLYCRTPFGKINKTNKDIIRTANRIGRTPSSLGMKMCNFARFDPILRNRNIKGLAHGSRQDEIIWEEFTENWEGLAFESQRAMGGFENLKEEISQDRLLFDPDIPTEAQKSVRVRLVQSFFRETVLSSYNFSCAICKLNLPMMLNASHIIPWSEDKTRRADPQNGLSLCVFHDRAFDRGLIAVDDDFSIILSGCAKAAKAPKLHRVGLMEIEGKKIILPHKFKPDKIAFAYHREKIFMQ
jgi:putative restriction endonuclease